MTTQRTVSTLVSIALIAACAAPGLAQQRAGSDGRALDANPQVGARTNSQIGPSPLDYRLRNTLVTGNAGAGQSLQIEAPYRSEFEFGDRLGSDDLFQFQRDSIQSAPARLNAPRAGAVNLGGGTAVFRSYTNAPPVITGALSPERLAPIGGSYGYSQLEGSTLLTDANRYTQVAPADALPQLPGRVLEVTADPLLGLRQRAIPRDYPLDRLAPTTAPRPRDFTPTGEEPADSRANFRVEPPRYVPLLAAPALSPIEGQSLLAPDQPATQLGMTAILGRQMQGRLGAERADRLDPVVEQRLQRVGENLLNRAAIAQQSQTPSPYTDLLTAVQDPRAAQEQAEANRGERPTMTFELEEQQLRQAEEQRAEALRRAYGLPVEEDKAADSAAPVPGATPEDGPALPEDSSLSELIDRLNYELPPLQSLAGDSDSRAAAQMKQAEQHLQQEEYFEAERLYRQALQTSGDPLAQVGLVHAQLGAGLIRSAALNLRQLFEQHPEVIAARYSKNLLPPEDRLNWVRGELESMLTGDAAAEAAIMLAYLGYQVDSRQLVRYGLATAEARAPRDPLLPVLRSIWLDDSRPLHRSSDNPGLQPSRIPAPADQAGGSGSPSQSLPPADSTVTPSTADVEDQQ